jgi:hypothetical protein
MTRRRTWLTPRIALPTGKARTVGSPSKKELEAARAAKWRLGPKGRAYLARNRERRNAYHLAYYYDNAARLRPYRAQKAREYREARGRART